MKPSARSPSASSSAPLSSASRISRPIAGSSALGQPRDRPEVEHADPTEPAVGTGQIRKLPGCGSAWSIPVRAGPSNRKWTKLAVVVALLLAAVPDHVGHGVRASRATR